MLKRVINPLRIKHYFHQAAQAMDLVTDLRGDLSLLATIRRSLIPLPIDREPEPPSFAFPRTARRPSKALAGKRVGIVATGGGGAMVCAIGVVRALEEAGVTIGGISACSGSAMALAPIAAGLSAQETAVLMLGLRRKDYVDPDLRQFLKLPFAMGRGFTGFIKAEAIEALYDTRLGRPTVGDLPIPFYANVWDMDRNRLLHLGTRTKPGLSIGRLVRAAVTLPLFMRPLEIDGAMCGDGGVVSIFPVDPLVDHHPEIDFFIGINAFYPENFDGEDKSGWDRRTWSVLRVANQTYQCQHLESARMQLRRIADRCLMVHPLPYEEIKGAKLYEQFLDRSRWPEFITAGYEVGRKQLAALERRPAARKPRSRATAKARPKKRARAS